MADLSLTSRDYRMAIDTLKAADSVLAIVIERVGECQLDRSQRTGDLFSSLSQSIIYQQISGKAAASIHRRWLALYPDRSAPTAQDILDTDDDTLRSAGLSRSKVIYIKDLATQVLAGLPSIDELQQMDDETIVRQLTQVKGIGRWTVQMLLIFRLHRWDVLPADDLGVRSAVRKTYDLEDLPDRQTLERMGQQWQPYRTIASWYLWRSLDLPID